MIKFLNSDKMICYNKELLNDIRSYHKTKKKILNIYKNNGFIDNNNYNNDNNLYTTIQNDLSSYFNDDLAYMYCLSLNNMLRLKRLYVVKIRKNLFDIIINFHFNFNNDIKSSINRYIGCMTIDERLEFINQKSI